jgi:GDP-L-fucose synthase
LSASFWEADRACLVTGCGFVGSHLVDALLDSGARVRVVTRSRAPHRTHPKLEAITADLSRPQDCLRAVQGMECVFLAAGSVGAAGTGASGVMSGIATNLTLTANVLQAAWQGGVRRALVFSSSTAYPVIDRPAREDELWEGPVFPGYFGYGWMRRYFERLAEFVASESDMGIAVVRPAALYGPRDNFDPTTGHVVSSLIRRAVAGESPLKVWGTGNDIRDFLHVRDFARGCLLALDRKADCDPINLGSGTGVSTGDLARLILTALGRPTTDLRFEPDRPSALPYRVLDMTKASAALGYAPQISFPEGLAEVIAWYRGQALGQTSYSPRVGS